MSRVISCPHCQRKLSVRDELTGKRLACPTCKGEFQVPASLQPAPARGTPRRAASAKAKGVPLLAWYIGGGAAAAVLLIVVAVMVTGGACGGGKGKNANVKFGLSEGKRKLIFEELIKAVDQGGEAEAKKTLWPRIEAEYGIDADKREKILEEGFNNPKWLLPSIDHYTAQTKANRRDWLRGRNQQQDLSPRRR